MQTEATTIATKRCKGPCGQVKPLDAFYPRKDAKDGRRGVCSECWLAHYRPGKRAYYAANRERINAERRGIRAANPEPFRERDRAYRNRHLSAVLTRQRLCREANRDELNARKRAAYAADPERVKAWVRADYFRHHEQRKATNRAYYWRNRDAILARQKAYRANNADYVRLRDLKWRLLHPERVRAKHQRYHLKHRERRLVGMRECYRTRYRPANSLDYGYSHGLSHDRAEHTIWLEKESAAQRQAGLAEFFDSLGDRLTEAQAAFLLAFEDADYNATEAAKALGMEPEDGAAMLLDIRRIAGQLRKEAA